MIFKTLGNTGITLSRLGFGAMRLPMVDDGYGRIVDRDLAIPMIHRAFEGGVNYIDTAVGYCEQDSQRVVGEALAGWRDRVVVSTKNPYFGEDETTWRTNLENSLERLRVEKIDLYLFHGITWRIFTEHIEPRVWKWMEKAKNEGLVGHICCSFHDTNDALLKIADTGRFESITLQYNMLDRRLEDGIAHAHEKGIGIIVMGPVGGGRLGEPSSVMKGILGARSRIPEAAMRFVWANGNVDVAISGMSDMKQVEENTALAEDDNSIPEPVLAEMKEHLVRLRKMADLYCTGCGYCLPCPEGVVIPRIFELYNQARVYDIHATSRESYLQIGKVPWEPGKTADACIECGACESNCPQKIEIRKQLKDAHQVLAGT
jgi:predicted aldo/keto reductase-like oxidoreductase